MYTLAEAYLHDIDPFLIRFSGNFGIRWYGTAYALGFIVAWFIGHSMAKRGKIKLSTQQFSDFVIASIIGILVGGRLGWVVFYSPSAIWTFTDSIPYWEVLAINRGGMASHGGMIGLIISTYLFSRRHKVSTLHLLDISTLLAPFGLFFGRVANFINGELLGIACNPDYPLAVKFPHEIIEEWAPGTGSPGWGPEQFKQVTSVARYLDVTPEGWEHALNAPKYGADGYHNLAILKNQLFEAVQRGNEQVLNIVVPILTPRHPSQLYQACAEGIVLGIALWCIWLFVKPVRYGIIAAFFLIIYGVLRIITEIWRIPDLGVDRVMYLSRGQLLSSIMILLGLAGWIWIMKRDIPKIETK